MELGKLASGQLFVCGYLLGLGACRLAPGSFWAVLALERWAPPDPTLCRLPFPPRPTVVCCSRPLPTHHRMKLRRLQPSGLTCCWAAGPCVPKRGIPRPAGLWSWWVFCEIRGGGGQELEPVFLYLNLLSTVRPPPLETSMDFQVAKLGARQGGAGRGWLLGGEALFACRGWRAGVEKCGKSPRPDWKGGPGCHTLQGAFLVVKGSSLPQPCSWWVPRKGEGAGA